MDSSAETCGKAVAGGPGQVRRWLVDQVVPHPVQINQEEQLGSKTAQITQGSSTGK